MQWNQNTEHGLSGSQSLGGSDAAAGSSLAPQPAEDDGGMSTVELQEVSLTSNSLIWLFIERR